MGDGWTRFIYVLIKCIYRFINLYSIEYFLPIFDLNNKLPTSTRWYVNKSSIFYCIRSLLLTFTYLEDIHCLVEFISLTLRLDYIIEANFFSSIALIRLFNICFWLTSQARLFSGSETPIIRFPMSSQCRWRLVILRYFFDKVSFQTVFEAFQMNFQILDHISVATQSHIW